jgi:hypothetical protein
VGDTSVSTAGAIGQDGAYSLATMRDGLRSEGALPGPNRVTAIVPATRNTGQQSPASAIPPRAVVFSAPFNVESKENVIPLTVENP